MTKVFNPPPSWPPPARGWVPPSGWHPDPSWGPAPPGWPFWVEPDQLAAEQNDSSTHRIFISYRRSDCQPQANGLYDGLSHRLKSSSVFMDIDSIPPGVEFEQHIRDEIEICDLVLVLIGDNWLDRTGLGRSRRIDERNDFVRLEIETALASPRVQILPVLVEGASMPQALELPESIRALARINAIELSDRRWTADLERVSQAVEHLRHDRDARVQRERRAAYELPKVIVRPVEPPPPQLPVRPLGRVDAAPYGGQAATRSAIPMQDPAVWPGYPHMAQGPIVQTRPAGSTVLVQQNRTSIAGWLMILLPVLSFGLAGFVPALWSISQRKNDSRFRRQMIIFSVTIGALVYVGIFLAGSSPTDATGTSTTGSDVGFSFWFISVIAATIVAVLTRKAKPQLPGIAEELARRQQREEYRALTQRDVNLARSMNVGRPDLRRNYDDGGLLNMNALSVEALVQFGHMSTDEALQLVEARKSLDGFSSVEEIAQHTNLSEALMSRLGQFAVFL